MIVFEVKIAFESSIWAKRPERYETLDNNPSKLCTYARIGESGQ